MKKFGFYALILSLSVAILGCTQESTKKKKRGSPPPPSDTGDGTKPPDATRTCE